MSFPLIDSAESMAAAIRQLGIVPFIGSPIEGFSLHEMTAPGHIIFEADASIEQTPWDWKIACLEEGDIAYGKFLCGKAAFATIEWYKELRQWRLSQPKYKPDANTEKILSLAAAQGSVSSGDVRRLLGINKSKADALLTRLQMGCRLVTGDIQRVYGGPDLEYKGWQRASFCTPESLFDTSEIAKMLHLDWHAASLDTGHSSEEARLRLSAHIRSIAPWATDRQIARLLG